MGLTPSSGISLIVHLLVISSAKIYEIIRMKIYGNLLVSPVRTHSASRRVFNYGLSLVIIGVMSTLMLVSLFVALQTGVREGAKEPHVRYVKGAIKSLSNSEFGIDRLTMGLLFSESEAKSLIDAPLPAIRDPYALQRIRE